MRRSARVFIRVSLASFFFLPGTLSAQYSDGRIVSEHVRIRIPIEREWLGRETIGDLERCWRYVDGMVGEKLPRKILVEALWDRSESSSNRQEARIAVGMAQPAAQSQTKSFFLLKAAKEIARLALAELSRGAAMNQENLFVTEGLAEVIAREFLGSGRSLNGAWVVAHYLDRMKLLGFSNQSSWPDSSGGRQDLRAAAPGITFVMMCRELYGREKVLKLFEALRKADLQEALAMAFKTPARAIEDLWLKKVREYSPGEDFTATSAEESPVLRQTTLVPVTGRPGGSVEMSFLIQDSGSDLSPSSVFLDDRGSGRVLQGRLQPRNGSQPVIFSLPIEEKRQPGKYTFRASAVDEAGNIRHWDGSYVVER